MIIVWALAVNSFIEFRFTLGPFCESFDGSCHGSKLGDGGSVSAEKEWPERRVWKLPALVEDTKPNKNFCICHKIVIGLSYDRHRIVIVIPS